jgi:hypothetical protein
MPDVPPYQRLDPNAQPWGRWVTDRTSAHDQAIDSLQKNTKAQNQSLAAQLNRLQLQVGELNEIVEQQAEVLANQVSPDAKSTSAGTISVGSSYSTILSLSFTPPAGFTRAFVTAVGFWNAGNNTGVDAGRAYLKCVISGSDGPESIGVLENIFVPITATASQSIGVTPGVSFNVLLQGKNQVGTTAPEFVNWCVANMVASVLYLR